MFVGGAELVAEGEPRGKTQSVYIRKTQQRHYQTLDACKYAFQSCFLGRFADFFLSNGPTG